jgi:teichuronic acid biosynthesis glycosyltransferase TuaC
VGLRVLVVAEYYPRTYDPVLGVWAHRQAVAAREAGAEVEVLVLHRPVPPAAAIRARDLRQAMSVIAQPAAANLDGLPVRYLRYLSPPRSASYGSWGAWAAPAVVRALRQIRRRFAFELIHAHYAVPAGDAVRRAAPDAPLIVSVHGHDVRGAGAGGRSVRQALAHARLVLANSSGTARRCVAHGASRTRVVHLGSDLPAEPAAAPQRQPPTLVTVAHLAARKRHADVISALALLAGRHPELRYVIVGDGPEREPLRALAASLGVAERVELRRQLEPAAARAVAQSGSLFVMPSVEEAFGVAYVEAMAAGVPAIGCRGEDGPQEIAASGGGIALVPAGDVQALAARIDALLSNPEALAQMGLEARATVEAQFTWAQCGAATVAAYRSVLGGV